jgi:signal recognition particle receptor subunit beta
MHFNLQKRELTLKVVYYGPALSGKTTNLQALHAMAPQDTAGRLMTLETRDDRTLFFDLLPMAFRGRNGARVKLKLFTVPGQVIHDSTRKLVLQGADAVVFVADSQIAGTEANKESFRNLRVNLQANGLSPDLPLVIQFNKRDLPNIRSDAELRRLAQARSTPIRPAIALRGEGVRETLETLLSLTWQRLALEEKLGVAADDFLQQMFARWRPPRPVAGGAS